MREPNDHDRFGQTQRVSVERDGGIQIVDFDDQPQRATGRWRLLGAHRGTVSLVCCCVAAHR